MSVIFPAQPLESGLMAISIGILITCQGGSALGDQSVASEAEAREVDQVTAKESTPNTAKHHKGEPNRLIDETSPYLLQHAYNPMDWYPWGEEAFQKARLENKPIFLSVGYSTCYWCHVMERESFENPEIAAFMNEHFINIKVDREERPDVDDVYMTAVQLMTRQGGWPMSVFLEPEGLRPFFGGTYFPPKDQGNRPGFLSLAASLNEAWGVQQQLVLDQAMKVADAIGQQMARRPAAVPVGQLQIDEGVSELMSRYDQKHAGYGGAPKFPMPVTLEFLMDTGWKVPEVRASILHTLDQMAMGGMYDQVGGGFHRYSTDEKWLVPHFEKMLYDNGMLASVYAEACARTGDPYYCDIAREIVDYVLREMTAEGGAFYSAQDAESNAREGESYLWTEQQVRQVLGEAGVESSDIDLVTRVYGLDQGTNFQDPHHLHEPAKNVLYLTQRPDELAKANGLTQEELMRNKLERARSILLKERCTRDQPLTDDKIIVGWNGLMIGGLADVGRVVEDDRYIQAAARAADWIHDRMWSAEEGLQRTARDGQVKIKAFLEDYALLIRGLLSLHEATGEERWLEFARHLMDQARADFWDNDTGGWFDTRDGQTDLLVRGRNLYDGALPSGSGTMLMDLVRLKEACQTDELDRDIRDAIASASWSIQRSPNSASKSTQALARVLARHPELMKDLVDREEIEAGRVTLSVDPGSIQLNSGKPTEIMVVLEIEKGWHLTAPNQEDPFAVGMSVASLDPNIQIEAKWPEAVPYEGAAGKVTAYDGVLRIPMQITASGEVEAMARIMITWQACNDEVCEQPRSQRIPLTIEMLDNQ
ncbi:MAG: thioredoxin domain-containing protein [Phycisphaerae bacterium]|nr:thioredoxin domain-containing protein [Phycisphaerae bacterium]